MKKPSSAKTVAAAVDAEPLDHLIWHLGRAFYAYVGLAERILVDAELNHLIRPGMGNILFALYGEDDLSVKDIAARTELASSTLAGILSRMESVGLVKRSRDVNDGRLVRVRLTPTGRKLEGKCRDLLKQINAVFHAGVGEKNVPIAKKLLHRLTVACRHEEQRLAKTQTRTKV